MVNQTTVNLNPVTLFLDAMGNSNNAAKSVDEVIRLIALHANLPEICEQTDKHYLQNQFAFLFELREMFEQTGITPDIMDENEIPEGISHFLESDKVRLEDLQAVYKEMSTQPVTDNLTRTLNWISEEMEMLKSELEANTRRIAVIKRNK